jgi:hypothetical protein
MGDFRTLLQLQRLYSVKWNRKIIIIWNEDIVINLNIFSQHWPEENNEIIQNFN